MGDSYCHREKISTSRKSRRSPHFTLKDNSMGSDVFKPDSIEWLFEGQASLAVLWFVSSPASSSSLSHQQVVSLYQSSCVRRRGWERNQIIRQRESLVLFKSFNTLCFKPVAPLTNGVTITITYNQGSNLLVVGYNSRQATGLLRYFSGFFSVECIILYLYTMVTVVCCNQWMPTWSANSWDTPGWALHVTSYYWFLWFLKSLSK
jgi:hypothetical protein